jgi:hypothetical protein
LKTHVARDNTTFKLSDVERMLLEEYDRIEQRDWAGCEKEGDRLGGEVERVTVTRETLTKK